MAWMDITELIYPVDTVYTSMSRNNDPNNMFIGSWQLIDENGRSINNIEETTPPYKWRRLS